MEEVKNHYEGKNLLFKTVNVKTLNRKRLENVTPKSAFIELLTNGFEHGNGIVNILLTPEYIEVFNNMKPEELEGLDFIKILEALESFSVITNTNNHEGLITLEVFPICINAGDIEIKNRRSEDGFYQYIGDASHYIEDVEEDGETKHIIQKQKDVEYVNGWRVRVFFGVRRFSPPVP